MSSTSGVSSFLVSSRIIVSLVSGGFSSVSILPVFTSISLQSLVSGCTLTSPSSVKSITTTSSASKTRDD